MPEGEGSLARGVGFGLLFSVAIYALIAIPCVLALR